MNGERDNNIDKNDREDEDLPEDEERTIVIDESDVDLGETSAGIDVEELVAKIESKHGDEIGRKRDVKKRLDDHLQVDDEFGSTYNFNLDDDLSKL